MRREAEILAVLDLAQRATPEFSGTLEVSLDCWHCQRTRRTGTFVLGENFGRCSPGSARHREAPHPPFPGHLLSLDPVHREGRVTGASYKLEYETAPFDDVKYGTKARPWSGNPTWARVSFTVRCAACGEICNTSTQNNLVRPREQGCKCGAALFVETRELPIFRFREPTTGQWSELPQRGAQAERLP